MKIGIALIHNNREERNEYIFPKISMLTQELEKKHTVIFKDYSYQPEIIPLSFISSILKEIRYWKVGCHWIKHRELWKFLFINYAELAYRIFQKCIRNSKENRKKSFIEAIVSDKHITAWQDLAVECDFCCILEDDAIFKNNSIFEIQKLLEKCKKENLSDKYTYIDMAGGCDFALLKVNKLIKEKRDKYIFFKKIVTNTACAYFFNKKLALHMTNLLIKKPNLRLLPIDWLINALCIDLNYDDSYCLHCEPQILLHGSFENYYEAWIERQ